MPEPTHRTNRKPGRKLLQILAENIRRRRQQCGFSQEDLAEYCHLHRTYISSVERGQRNITLGTLEIIAIVLGSKPDEMLRRESKS